MNGSRFRCHGCGAALEPGGILPFRCPNHGSDDIDHVLVRELSAPLPFPVSDEPNPFLRYGQLFHLRHIAHVTGLSDEEVDALVRDLDARVAAVDGTGFRATSCARSEVISDELAFADDGGVWVKDETGQVAGSHKARHLFGVLVYLEAARRRGAAASSPPRRLAIASCGNAALAAAVVARAGERELSVFVPEHADEEILGRLRGLGADVVSCARRTDVAGDPCVHAFRDAVVAGALPFTCQGNENGLAIEGGHTLGWELADELEVRGEAPDHVVIQVGGGALASALAASLREAVDAGALAKMPRIHTVQTESVHPLQRAHRRVAERMDEHGESLDDAMRHAVTHRSRYMQPWEGLPASLAEGILDDETYDWWEVLRATLSSGGSSVVVNEAALRSANDLARGAGYAAGFTGSAALAALPALRADGTVRAHERVVLLMTGARRGRGG